MDVALKNALAGPARTFTAVRMELPDVGGETYVVRLLNGGQALIDGEAFTGRDARFGTLDSVGTLSDGMDTQASSASLILLTADDAALAMLVSPKAQGSPVLIRQGAVDTATGATLGVETLFRGELNYGVVVADESRRAVRLELITEEARALEPNDERRLSPAFHKACWPGELGMDHVTGVAEKDYWRLRKPAVSYGGGGFGGTGNGGGFSGSDLTVLA
ncbi:hypothetical protein [Brevundimonas sp.]|uniref:hypothetical protein n=2 Tax=Brevundimonas sp. TaxID=1871086 RepID=UPI004033C721